MYLMCPSCSSVFELNSKDLGEKGRKVCCAVCKKTWRAKIDSLLPHPPSFPEPKSPSKGSSKGSNKKVSEAKAPDYDRQTSAPAPTSAGKKIRSYAPTPTIASPQEESKRSNIPTSSSSAGHVANATDGSHKTSIHHFAPLQFAERNVERFYKSLWSFTFSWVTWGFFIASCVYALHTYPTEIISRFPEATHLYERLDIMSPSFAKLTLRNQDYSIEDVKVSSEFRFLRDILMVTASIGNRTAQVQRTPILKGSFRNELGEETGYFHFQPEVAEIPSKALLEYRINVDLPHPSTTTLLLTLISDFEKQLDLGSNRLKVREPRQQP